MTWAQIDMLIRAEIRANGVAESEQPTSDPLADAMMFGGARFSVGG